MRVGDVPEERVLRRLGQDGLALRLHLATERLQPPPRTAEEGEQLLGAQAARLGGGDGERNHLVDLAACGVSRGGRVS